MAKEQGVYTLPGISDNYLSLSYHIIAPEPLNYEGGSGLTASIKFMAAIISQYRDPDLEIEGIYIKNMTEDYYLYNLHLMAYHSTDSLFYLSQENVFHKAYYLSDNYKQQFYLLKRPRYTFEFTLNS